MVSLLMLMMRRGPILELVIRVVDSFNLLTFGFRET